MTLKPCMMISLDIWDISHWDWDVLSLCYALGSFVITSMWDFAQDIFPVCAFFHGYVSTKQYNHKLGSYYYRKIPHISNVKGGFFYVFYTIYSTLLHLPPLRIHCVGGCWDRTQDSCDYGIGFQTLLPLIHTRLDLIHIFISYIVSRKRAENR
jgi:hypothetical protein